MTPHFSIPKEWDDVLSKIKEQFSGARIAGGALRDLDYNRPVKDVDIWIPTSSVVNGTFDAELRGMFNDINLSHANVYGRIGEEVHPDRELLAVYNFEDSNYKYEIIVAQDSSCILDSFDMSICQIEYDGINLRTTLEYDKTKDTGLIKVLKSQSRMRRDARIARMKSYFPNMHVEETVPVTDAHDTPTNTDGIPF